MTESPRVLMMGTPDFAVPILESIVQAGYSVVGVFTQPDRPVGRRRTLSPPPLKEAAQRLGLPVFQPGRLRQEEVLQQVAQLAPDVAVTAAYGQLLPQGFLDIPRFGCLNVHASLLPRWRGAAPIQRAIMAGDEKTGVTIMKTVLALDAGPVLKRAEVPIEASDTFGSLHDKLAHAGAKLLLEVLPEYLSGLRLPVPQLEDGVTYAQRILRQDEFLQLHQDAQSVYNHARALSPWPGASVLFEGQTMKVWPTALLSEQTSAAVGTVNLFAGTTVGLRCGDGWVSIAEVQPAGKRRMNAVDWLNGQKGKAVNFQSVAMAQ